MEQKTEKLPVGSQIFRLTIEEILSLCERARFRAGNARETVRWGYMFNV